MAVTSFLNKIATYLVIIFFLLGVWDAMQMAETEIPVYETAWGAANSGDFGYMFSLAKMSWGWSQITPAVNVDTLPWYLSWYGWYFKIFFPSGYMPLPGWEDFLFIGGILVMFLPFAIMLKKKRQSQGSVLGIPWWFWALIPITLLAMYPVWCWIHLHWLFIPGAQEVFGMSPDAAYQIWYSFALKSESFSWFFVFMTLLGVYKGGQWGMKFKKW